MKLHTYMYIANYNGSYRISACAHDKGAYLGTAYFRNKMRTRE